MKISFDVQLLLRGEKTGIGWCADNILKSMSNCTKYDYELNCFTLGYTDEQLKNIEKYSALGYSINKCTWFHNFLYRMIWNLVSVPYSLFFGKDSDITFFFNYVIPPGVKGKKITMVHDMAYKAHPETVRKKTRTLLNIALRKSCKRADKIITISEFSKKEIIKYMGIEEKKIVVMPIGVDTSVYHPNYTEKDVNNIKEKYNIKAEYFLYLGTLEPRKNIEKLISAYAQLKSEISDIPILVLAGKKGWMYDGIFETVQKLHMKDSILFTGYVDEEDAPILIKGARIFLFPSLYEGFGMPPLEAMACGTPVVVSNVSSLPEVVGDAGILVDPMSIEGIKEGMKILNNGEGLRKKFSKMGLERAKEYTWEKSTERLICVFDKLNK